MYKQYGADWTVLATLGLALLCQKFVGFPCSICHSKIAYKFIVNVHNVCHFQVLSSTFNNNLQHLFMESIYQLWKVTPDDSVSDVETSECYVLRLSSKTLFPAIITFHFIICRTLTLMAHALYRVVWIIHWGFGSWIRLELYIVYSSHISSTSIKLKGMIETWLVALASQYLLLVLYNVQA